MTLAGSIFLIAVGAILRFATHFHVKGLDLKMTAGRWTPSIATLGCVKRQLDLGVPTPASDGVRRWAA